MEPTYLLAALVVAIGSALQGTVGVGLGMLASPILLLIVPGWVPAPLLMANLLLALLVTARDRRGLRVKEVAPAIAGRIPGALLGGALVASLAAATLDIVLGALLLGTVMLAAWNPRSLPMTRRNLVAAGFLSGISGTAVSVGGPPIVVVVRELQGERLRATLSGYFMVGCTLSIAILAAYGQIGRAEIAALAYLCPAVVLGFAVSMGFTSRFQGDTTRRAILLLSGSASALVLLRGISRWMTA